MWCKKCNSPWALVYGLLENNKQTNKNKYYICAFSACNGPFIPLCANNWNLNIMNKNGNMNNAFSHLNK